MQSPTRPWRSVIELALNPDHLPALKELLRQDNGCRMVLSLNHIMRSFSVEVNAYDLEPLALPSSALASSLR